MHDTLAGIRVDGNMQVIDIYGQKIPRLFAVGEASGGMRVHGLGRVMTSGYIAGRAAASVDENGFATADTSLNPRSEEHTSELQSRFDLVCRLLLEKKKIIFR